MPIHLHVSNDLSVLAARLTDRVGRQQRDPFQSAWIVTQTEGMNDWLRQRFAADHGIAANLRFCTPDDVVSQIRFWLDPGGRNPLDREIVRWAVYGLIGTTAFQAEYPEKAAYFSDSEIRRISLADEMADLFDQYQIYRDDLLGQWQSRRTRGEAPADWQEWLWARLQEQLSAKLIDRVEAKRTLRELLQQDPEARGLVGRRMPALQVFGVAVITPYHLEILYVLSAFIEVHLYLMNPAPGEYWLDDTTERLLSAKNRRTSKKLPDPGTVTLGNELLLNLGRLIRESFQLLFRDQDMINQYDPEETPLPAGNRLLQKIQKDIQGNFHGSAREEIRLEDIRDGSIVLSGSFTPLREVEALYNHLVQLVDQTAGISPRDILVQVSDIDLYAPYIQAVFGNAGYRLPFSIADRSVTADNNLFTAVQALLSIDTDKMKAEEVLQLLESPYIRKRFGITDTEDIRDAVRQAGIIYSLEGRKQDDTHYISWHHGLKRILYGLCLSGGLLYNDGQEDLLPLDSAEGAGAAERIRFIHFLNRLEQLLLERRAPRTIAGWADYLKRLLEELVFEAGSREDEDHPHFVSLLEELSMLDDHVKVEVSFAVFRHSFLHRLTREHRSKAFLSQGITFCSMVPMRSIPFRVIAMLGMDYDKFPRRDSGVSFSYLLTGEPRPGDRNIRNNDRHLFLETLLSAREKLYISYCARDGQNADLLPPSSLVDELIDYVAKGIAHPPESEVLRSQWLLLHPLHSFSRAYFDPQTGLRNYLSESRFKTPIVVGQGVPQSQTFDLTEIDIDELVGFLQNPPKTLLQRQLNVRYYDEEWLLPDHEVFELDSLQQHGLRQDLLRMDPVDLPDYISKQQRAGNLPLHNMGPALAEHVLDEIREIRDSFQEACQGRSPAEVEIDIPLPDGRIKGRISGVYGDDLIVVCTSSGHFKYLLAGYVRYLALLAAGHKVSFVFISKKIRGLHRIEAGKISAAEALDRLERFADYYRQGHVKYFRFYPTLAREQFGMLRGDHEAFIDQLEALEDNPRNFDFSDEYLRKAIEHGFFSEDAFDQLKANVFDIMNPIYDLLPVLFPKK